MKGHEVHDSKLVGLLRSRTIIDEAVSDVGSYLSKVFAVNKTIFVEDLMTVANQPFSS